MAKRGGGKGIIWYSNDGNSAPVSLRNSEIIFKKLRGFPLPPPTPDFRLRVGSAEFDSNPFFFFLSSPPQTCLSIANDNKIHKQITEFDWPSTVTLPCAVNDRFDGRLIIFLPHVTDEFVYGAYTDDEPHNVMKRDSFLWRYEIPDMCNYRNVYRAGSLAQNYIIFT